jgi:hypothetical protein
MLLAGCSIDIGRQRSGVPLSVGGYERLRPGEARLQNALDELGAPDRVEWKSGSDYLWWHHLDNTALRVRFELPVSFFGYRHDVFQYVDTMDQANTIAMVFDENGVLTEKSLNVPDIYRFDPERRRASRIHIGPRLEHSVFIAGETDFALYRDTFRNGYLAGVEAGIQPVPPLVFRLGGSYSAYPGKELVSGSSRLNFAHLDLYSAELGLRLQMPVDVIPHLFQIQEVWRYFFEEDPERADGWLLYVEGGVGATFNSNVPVSINAIPRGNYLDSGWGFLSTGGGGVEYSWKHLSVRIGFSFRSTDGFDEGNSPVPSGGATGFNTWMGGAALSIKF